MSEASILMPSNALATMSASPKPRARIAKIRLPPDLADAIALFAARAQADDARLNMSGVMRLLLRYGLAADARLPIDLRDAAFREGWMAGHGEAVHVHQRAFDRARVALRTPTD